MVSKLLSLIRDVFLCYVLLLLLRVALNDTTTYFLNHKESIIHELDRTFLDYLYTAQRQLHILEEIPCSLHDTNAIIEIKNRITSIEEQYKKNSPGLALLGPLGTTAIVVKEEQLQKKLLIAINDIGALLHHIVDKTTAYKPAATLNDGLTSNKQLMKSLIA